ncbi:MAG: fumarate hydratase [Epulopiscium sp.]|nr:fumarate hydratase [Candidatus Epulonipiscium sp.]
MRTIHVKDITQAVGEMCIAVNYNINPHIQKKFQESLQTEVSPIGKEILHQLIENAQIAATHQIPICQDTGMVVVFCDIGQDVHLVGGNVEEAIHEGVRQGYVKGYLRKSVVDDPILRKNTKDNTPAVIHYRIVPGEKVYITVAPKGFGSENMSHIYMLAPSDGIDGVKKVVLQTIEIAGSNACPPMVVGVGLGGTFEKAALLAKKALLRPIGTFSSLPHIAQLEEELIEKANQLGIGPQGLGGSTTVLGIHVETYPTHIAGLPVAINMSCHVTRHIKREL